MVNSKTNNLVFLKQKKLKLNNILKKENEEWIIDYRRLRKISDNLKCMNFFSQV